MIENVDPTTLFDKEMNLNILFRYSIFRFIHGCHNKNIVNLTTPLNKKLFELKNIWQNQFNEKIFLCISFHSFRLISMLSFFECLQNVRKYN